MISENVSESDCNLKSLMETVKDERNQHGQGKPPDTFQGRQGSSNWCQAIHLWSAVIAISPIHECRSKHHRHICSRHRHTSLHLPFQTVSSG